jgi:hypothetical protein
VTRIYGLGNCRPPRHFPDRLLLPIWPVPLTVFIKKKAFHDDGLMGMARRCSCPQLFVKEGFALPVI